MRGMPGQHHQLQAGPSSPQKTPVSPRPLASVHGSPLSKAPLTLLSHPGARTALFQRPSAAVPQPATGSGSARAALTTTAAASSPAVAATLRPALPGDAAGVIGYRVQRGETLWDVARLHNARMADVRELNGLLGKDPIIKEGQTLMVPAPAAACTPVAAAAAVAMGAGSATAVADASSSSTAARELWAGSKHVHHMSVDEAEQLYVQLCDRANDHHTLMVLYAPWCTHCQGIEKEVERLAAGLAHVPSLRVVAINADTPAGRLFAREVLGMAYYPAIAAMPAHSRTYYKHASAKRDAQSLLKFINMTCCGREGGTWELQEAAATNVLQATGTAGLARLGSVHPAAAALVGGLVLLAGAAALAAKGQRAAASAAAVGDAAASGDPLAQQLDGSLGKMAVLMWRLSVARAALLLGLQPQPPAATPAPAPAPASAAAAAAQPAPEPGAVQPPDSGASAAAEALAAAAYSNGNGNGRAAEPSSPAVSRAAVLAMGTSVVGPNYGTAPQAATPATPATPVPAAAAPLSAAAAVGLAAEDVGGPLGELSPEDRLRLTHLTDDELIQLVNSEPDLQKVLGQLLVSSGRA